MSLNYRFLGFHESRICRVLKGRLLFQIPWSSGQSSLEIGAQDMIYTQERGFHLLIVSRKDKIMRNMTKKRLGLIFVLLFAFLFGGFSWADSAKIAIVDTQKVLQESKAAKEARTSLLADIKKKRALFQRKQEEARQLQKELSRQSKDASPDALQEKREKLAQEVKSLKRLKVDMEEDLRRKNMELTKKILREIREVVKDYRKKKKYTVILEKKTVIAADDSIDITEQIIKLYDKKKK